MEIRTTKMLGMKTRGQSSAEENGTPTVWVRREPERLLYYFIQEKPQNRTLFKGKNVPIAMKNSCIAAIRPRICGGAHSTIQTVALTVLIPLAKDL